MSINNERGKSVFLFKMNIVFIILFLNSIFSPLFAIALKWDIKEGERIEFTKSARVRYYINSDLKRIYEERNIIDLTCSRKTDSSMAVNGVFSVFHRESGTSVFRLREQYLSEFSMDTRGRMDVSDTVYMPNLRHLPSFPASEVKPGDSWSAPVDMIVTGFSLPLKLLLSADYKLLSVEKNDGKEIANIKYKYTIEKDLTKKKYPADFPMKIIGTNEGIIKWDIASGKPVDTREAYHVMFIFGSGRQGFSTLELRMDMDSKNSVYSPFTEDQKQKDKAELKKSIPEGSGIEVETDKRGMVLRLGDVLFDFDSFSLKKEAVENLYSAAEAIKKKYPDREIIVEGHTDITGDKSYNMKLSEKRSQTVAEFLKAKMGHDKISYRGFGSALPVADNSSKEGRQKNRRVEIIIKLK